MARRRLNTILATTTLAAGLSVAPAWGQSLGDLTDTVEDTVTETTEVVEDTTETVTDTVTETTEEVTGTLDPSDTDDTSGDTDVTDVTDVTDDAPVDADLEVDIAPEDEDGSPQLEVDGGVTVGDQTIDVGSVTDPIEDAVDPDPDPEPSPSPSPDSNEPDDHQTDTSGDSRESGNDTWNGSRLGGLVEGGGVTAAGGDARPAEVPGSGSNDGNGSGRTVGESFAAFVANNRGSNWSRGGSGSSTGSTASSEIAPPQVAAPADPSFEQFPASQVEEPTVLATPAATGDPASPMEGILKSLAALMVLGTGVAFKRTLDEA